MPYEWTPTPQTAADHWQLSLWPYRSLLRKDFVTFMVATIALIALPLISLLGTVIVWALLPFFAVMFGGLWAALNISYKRGEILEELVVDDTSAHLTRYNPKGDPLEWHANRYWVSVHLHPKGGPVENYITLRGGDREVEIGAFLDVSERLALYGDLKRALRGDTAT
jgi:uncharacterized membrane protein